MGFKGISGVGFNSSFPGYGREWGFFFVMRISSLSQKFSQIKLYCSVKVNFGY